MPANNPTAVTSSGNASRAIYLVRHAEKQGDALTPTGQLQASKLAALLKDAGITTIYTSQFERTKLTALPLKLLIEGHGETIRLEAITIGASLLNAPTDPDLLEDYGNTVIATLARRVPKRSYYSSVTIAPSLPSLRASATKGTPQFSPGSLITCSWSYRERAQIRPLPAFSILGITRSEPERAAVVQEESVASQCLDVVSSYIVCPHFTKSKVP